MRFVFAFRINHVYRRYCLSHNKVEHIITTMRLTAPVGGKCKMIGGFWYPEYLASQMYGNVLVERKSELRSLHLIFITFPPLWGGRAGWKPNSSSLFFGVGFQFTTRPVCPIDEYWPPKLIQWTLATFYGHFKCTVTFSPTRNCWIWNPRFCAVSERPTWQIL